MILEILIWTSIGTIIYTYAGYPALLFIFSRFSGMLRSKSTFAEPELPPVTIIIPAYNEGHIVPEKVKNTYELDYPKDKLHIIWVTDGTTDNTYKLLSGFQGLSVLHTKERKGKMHAMTRGLKAATTSMVIFTDANSMLNREAVTEVVRMFSDPETGCVTGEKRIVFTAKQKAAGAGEGLYWHYESWIKNLESATGSVIGAAGELFALRRELYEEVSNDTILDDFTISIMILLKGYRIKYASKARGTESASASVKEELKRKIRIATGDIQVLVRKPGLMNPFKYGMNTWKYISHKVLRWTLVPLAFPVALISNLFLLGSSHASDMYFLLFFLQIVFYLLVISGALLRNRKTNQRMLFAPYYLFIMNYAMMAGLIRFISGRYSVTWQKVRRDEINQVI